MGRRILNRKELRADFDASERRKPEDQEEVAEEEGEEEDEDEEEKGEDDEEAEATEGDAEGEEDDEEAAEAAPPKKKKAVKAKVVKPKARTRTAKVIRQRLVWGVFNNSHQCVASYDYPKRKEAEAHAAKLMADKKSTHFVQPVKEPIEEKKEKA